jgi:hypothetical protein
LPGWIGDLSALQELYAHNADLRQLPASIGNLKQLQCLFNLGIGFAEFRRGYCTITVWFDVTQSFSHRLLNLTGMYPDLLRFAAFCAIMKIDYRLYK